MRNHPLLVAAIAALALPAVTQDTVAPTPSLSPLGRPSAPLEQKARDFVALLVAGDFDATRDLMDGEMRQAMPPRRLEQFWTGLEAQAGGFERVLDATLEVEGGYRLVELTGEFERAMFTIRVVYDEAERVSGFFLVPAALAQPVDPPYADRSEFLEEETVVESGSVRLPGTLTIPMQGSVYPVAVFVHGSGPQDRDGTVGAGKVFRDMAWGLATLGVASLRYDKRTKHAPERLDPRTLTYREETVDDALAALEMVENDPRFQRDRVVLIGHSFGGTLAPLIARESDAVDGVVMMAASTEGFPEAMLRQTEYIFREDGSISAGESARLETLRDAVRALYEEGAVSPLFGGIAKPYFDALAAYDGPAVARSLTVPVFVTQGGRDYQTLPEISYADWQAALADHPGATFKLYPSLDHLFMAGSGRSYPSDYQEPRNVSEAFIGDVAEWMKALDD